MEASGFDQGAAVAAGRMVPAYGTAPAHIGQVIIEARDLELKSPLGCPYTGVNLDVRKGEVFAVCGRNGSGKTSLLLTMGGRMVFTKGSLTVLGYKMPRERGKVQKRVGLGLIKGQNDLPETQLVRLAVAAEFDLYRRKPTKEAVAAYLEQWDLLEYADMRIRELTERKLVQLGIALAWVGHPDIIIVDDIESQLVKAQSVEMMKRLLDLAHERHVTVLVAVLERDLAAMADNAYYLESR